MITNELYKKPRLSFGLGVQKKYIFLGDTITLFQNEVYNTETFELKFESVLKDMYAFEYTPAYAGVLELNIRIFSKDGKISLISNNIYLTVV